MDNIESIPLSSIIAYLLLKKKIVSYSDISYIFGKLSSLDCYIDDEDYDDTLYKYVDMTDDGFLIRKEFNYNSIINNDGLTLRSYFIILSSKLSSVICNIDLLSVIDSRFDSRPECEVKSKNKVRDRRKKSIFFRRDNIKFL